jgi:hypothetical protein
MNPEVPKWILVVSALFALLGFIVTCTLLFSPQSALEQVDLNARGAGYLISMWAARQFALGFIFGYATWRKSVPMLTISYIFFLVMNIGDVFIGFYQKDNSLIIGASVVCIIASSMLYVLSKRK